jgi:hypothetical protein
MPFWRSFYANHANVFFSAFGSPYLLHEQPHLPNLLALYSAETTAPVPCIGALPMSPHRTGCGYLIGVL